MTGSDPVSGVRMGCEGCERARFAGPDPSMTRLWRTVSPLLKGGSA